MDDEYVFMKDPPKRNTNNYWYKDSDGNWYLAAINLTKEQQKSPTSISG